MLAALMFIAIVILAGGFRYSYLMTVWGNLNGGASVQISGASLSALPGGEPCCQSR
ncbi:MAG: hypothetical protein JRN37_05850 [Nitrososphaerota archaeon]|jgi:hypothetical protein|nr:hypothetical protein [Nitrososphaerota archaeon]MDG7041392.1 hypothetical protein [Nitrososphaerota archaeon]MDG7043638.1 hypothetical protein [Nitrososphaerota archaeon]